VFRGRLGRLALGLFLLETTAAVTALLVVTIMPVIARDLNGLGLYGWALAAPGLATVAAIPVTGRAADRYGPVPVLAIMLPAFAAGIVVSALAPTMWVFVAGRLLQGAGAGAQFAVSVGALAKSFPEAHRPRVLALLSAAWLLPGLAGPLLGAVVARTLGWRWAFVVLLPLVVAAAVLVFPGLRAVPAARDSARPPLRWALLLAAGSAVGLAGLTKLSAVTAPLVAAGAVAVVIGMRRLTAPQAGIAAGISRALVASFLVTFAFFTADGFVPLMLVRVRGTTVLEASVVITTATVAWSVASWWQSRVIGRVPGARW
jgi:MFS family permease